MNVNHTFQLSGDGLSIIHVREEILPDGLDRRVTNARRIQSGKP